MKKKVLSLILCSALAVASLAGCSKDTGKDPVKEPETSVSTSVSTSVEDKVEAVAVPQDFTYYYSFDAKDDKATIQPTSQTIGGTPILAPIEKDKQYIPGVKGDSLYVDGVTGYKLADVNGVGDAYTVAFWLYPTRFANYMPTVQFGPDVHGDLTGGQKYVNITRAEWTGSGTFPCVWSYDQADSGLWPNWADAATGEMMKQWIHIALVVDPTIVSVDGRYIDAKLFVNGQEWIAKDSDGNVSYPGVVKGAMSASDNFDFLLGVNYWDSVFKGAFDELYIYNRALSAAEVAGLFADGNASVAYEEPTRVIDVKKNDKAIASLGATDFSVAEAVYEDVAIVDEHTLQFKLKHWSDGKDAKNNYYFVFKDAEGKEVARVNADMTGTVNGEAIPDANFSWSWGNWNTWEQSVMVETEVKANIVRNGDDFVLKISNVDYNKTDNFCEAKFTAGNIATVTVGTTNAYTDILAVNDMAPVAGTVLGATDLSQGWWQVFSQPTFVPEGETRTVKFKNFAGEANWNNFICVLNGSALDPSFVGTEGYVEYGVVRSDCWGWTPAGDLLDANKERDWEDWATWLADMNGADVELTVKNEGATARVDVTMTALNGTVYKEAYKDLAISGPLYFSLGVDHSYLVIEPKTIGATDLSQGWWSTFSEVHYVPANGSKTVSFTNYAGEANWNNFIVVLNGTEVNPILVGTEGYKEYGVVRSDCWGWTPAGDLADANKERDWEDWATWLADMNGAKVDVTVKNEGATARVEVTMTALNGTVYHETYKDLAIDGSLYFSLGVDHSYIVY